MGFVMRFVLPAVFIPLVTLIGLFVNTGIADTFGTGTNQFAIDFVPISGATNPSSGYGIVPNDYRMGTYAVSNDQWNKFTASLGVPVTGADGGYGSSSYYTDTNVPTNNVSWFEAAQFVNWLNTSTGHQPAYNFTGTQGTSNYTFASWSAAEAAGGTNLYRNKDAFYFLPTEDEWVKAAYWNGTSLQTYATKPGDTLFQGNGSGTGWNYRNDSGFAINPYGPWAVINGSQELNGTYNMMGNVHQWMESPNSDATYGASSWRGVRGGSFIDYTHTLDSSSRGNGAYPTYEFYSYGFRVASVIPEPSTFVLLGMGAMGLFVWAGRRSRKSI
jgi:formylglycine-generating enzyme required for sulfatase activity